MPREPCQTVAAPDPGADFFAREIPEDVGGGDSDGYFVHADPSGIGREVHASFGASCVRNVQHEHFFFRICADTQFYSAVNTIVEGWLLSHKGRSCVRGGGKGSREEGSGGGGEERSGLRLKVGNVYEGS